MAAEWTGVDGLTRGRGWAPPGRAAGVAGAVLAIVAAGAAELSAQDPNIHRPPARIESLLLQGEFEVVSRRAIRTGRGGTDLVLLDFEDEPRLPAKWARAPDGGEEWNNAPRYEIATYQLQKLFLDPGEYVVPPTVCRCFTPERYAELTDRGKPPDATFPGTSCVLTVLQYWLRNVTSGGVWDPRRMRRDTAYARHLSNLDVLTYLVDHKDANTGNFLVSTVPESPRVFVVDNGITFDSRKSPRGYEWRWLRVDRIPRKTAERLRGLTRQELRNRLSVLAQLERGEGGGYVPVEPSEPVDLRRGLRVATGVIQLGLDSDEIDDLHLRLRRLVERLDSGELGTF